MNITRTCTDCHQTKPVENFARRDKSVYPSGYSPSCKDCGAKNRKRFNDGGYQGRRAARVS